MTLLLVFSSLYIVRKYKKENLLEAGKALCVHLMNAGITYYREHGTYLINDKVSFNEDYPYDARTNSYFSIFSTYPVGGKKQAISVFGSQEMKDYELRVVFDEDSEIQNLKNIKIQYFKKKLRS